MTFVLTGSWERRSCVGVPRGFKASQAGCRGYSPRSGPLRTRRLLRTLWKARRVALSAQPIRTESDVPPALPLPHFCPRSEELGGACVTPFVALTATLRFTERTCFGNPAGSRARNGVVVLRSHPKPASCSPKKYTLKK